METVRDWLGRSERFLDEYGMPAWIAAMVGGFILFVPIGLFVLGYMIWSGRMGCWRGKRSERRAQRAYGGSTGNAAFDAYRDETLRRLEDERQAFGEFLDRLRRAKDQAEFDQFMTDRRAGGASGGQASGGQASGGQASGGQASGGFGAGFDGDRWSGGPSQPSDRGQSGGFGPAPFGGAAPNPA